MLTAHGFAWPANLLVNPGFESGVAYWNQVYGLSTEEAGWRWTAAENSSGFWNAGETAWGGGTTVRTGNYAVRVFHYGPIYGYPEGWRTSTIEQTVEVSPDVDYSASANVYIYLEPGAEPGSEFHAGLVVEELNATGTVVASHQQLVTDASSEWRSVSVTFRTTGSTSRVRYVLTQHWLLTESLNHINWDDCELAETLTIDVRIRGRVTAGGSGLSGATVTAGDSTATTALDGSYQLRLPPTTPDATVRAAMEGYYAQRKSRQLSPGDNYVSFDLVDRSGNLLANAGFDDWPAGGWVEETSGAGNCVRRGENWFIAGHTGLAPYYASGEEAVCFLLTSANSSGLWLRQSVGVRGGAQYTATIKTRISMAPDAQSIWGKKSDSQAAGLLVKEYDASGQGVRTHALVKSSEIQQWETLSLTFTTLASTTEVRLGPYAWMTEDSSTNSWWRRVTFDDVELRGPVGNWSLTGVVSTEQNPIPGATVCVEQRDGPTTHYTTDESGRYEAVVSFGSECAITADKPGFHAQSKKATITCPRIVDFDLRPTAQNLVFNPGFDDPAGWLKGRWRTVGPAQVLPETQSALWGHNQCASSPEAAFIRGPNAGGRVYQDVPVAPGARYDAAVRFMAVRDARWGSVWGLDPDQRAALFVQQFDASGSPIGSESGAYADVTPLNTNRWLSLSISVTTSPDAAYLRIGGYAYIIDDYDANLARAVFDDFELNGPAAPSPSIAASRALPDGATLRLAGKLVTARYEGFFYAQEPNRTSGIRVTGNASPGNVVDITGTLSTVGGERCITETCIISRAQGPVPRPLGINTRSAHVGLSPVGLYVTLTGRVKNRASGHFTIGTRDGWPLKVYGTAAADDMVRVTGALGLEDLGSGPVPVLRAVSATPISEVPAITRPYLQAAYVFDEQSKAQANQESRNYWWTYMAEVVDRLGLTAERIQPADLPARLDDLSMVFVGPSEAEALAGYPGFAASLQAWVASGGVLIACGAGQLDSVFGNEFSDLVTSADDFAVSGEFALTDGRFTQGVHSPLHPTAPLVTVGPVRKVRAVTSQTVAEMGGDAVITARRIGAGWAFYFGFDLGQTFWVIQQGRPVDADYDGDGYLRSGDAMVIGDREPEIGYTDELLFLLRNMISVRPHPLIHQLPPKGATTPDAVLFYGGDDEAGSGIQLISSEFMYSRGLPYHINCMPWNGAFPLTAQEIAQIEANGTELSLHYDFITGFPLGSGFTGVDVEIQTRMFRDHFGRNPVCTVNHWTRWTGWEDPARWMIHAGVKGDNSHFCVPLTSSNPTNRIGFAFGTAFPHFFWGSETFGNQRLQFVELPITAYEVGYSGGSADPIQVERALYLARYYELTMNFFYHPVYIASYPACRYAIDYLLTLIDQQGLNILHTTPNDLTLWWMDRSASSISNAQLNGGTLTFEASTPAPWGFTAAIPLGNWDVGYASHQFTVRETPSGQRRLMMALPQGTTQVRIDLVPRR